jgi:lactam utilization protein B
MTDSVKLDEQAVLLLRALCLACGDHAGNMTKLGQIVWLADKVLLAMDGAKYDHEALSTLETRLNNMGLLRR